MAAKGVLRTLEGDRLAFFCPGCKSHHQVYVGPAGWGFNGNFDRPTFTPSVLVNPGRENAAHPTCHSFVTDGQIQFLGDCTHELAGQTVALASRKPEWEA